MEDKGLDPMPDELFNDPSSYVLDNANHVDIRKQPKNRLQRMPKKPLKMAKRIEKGLD